MDRGDIERGKGSQAAIADLLAVLPKHPRDYYESAIGDRDHAKEFGLPFDEDLHAEINASIPKLRELTNNCPACIMAALRQANIPVPMAKGFNFSEEMKVIWAAINDADMEACTHG